MEWEIIFLLSVLLSAADAYVWFGRGYDYQECQDVAIVGGGIGGTYTGWKLRQRGWKVALFERTNRIGGRTFSVFFPSVPNVPAQLGAMRFVPGSHSTLESLLPKLGLQSEVFQPDQFEKMYYFRGTRLTAGELETPKLPFNLGPGESRNTPQLFWSLSQKALNVSEPDKIPDVEEFITTDGIPLYKQGFHNILGDVWSNEAREYLTNMGTFETDLGQNNNAVPFIIAYNPAQPGKPIRTVVGGMNRISEKLAEQFISASNRHTINLNRRVDSIRKVWYGGRHVYQLTVYETETVDGFTGDKKVRPYAVCANQVILALPPQALKNIFWDPLQTDPNIMTALDSITDYTAMKLFLAYPSAWWDTLGINKKAFVTDLPLRQGGEFGRFRNSSGPDTVTMMVSYNDGKPSNDYWRELSRLGNSVSSSAVPAAFSVSSKVVEHVHHHLGVLYGVSPDSLPWPLDGAMNIWDDPVNGRAWQTFKPGYKPSHVSKVIQWPSPTDRVFIVTNAFSFRFSSWVEGCLRAADDILADFFDMAY